MSSEPPFDQSLWQILQGFGAALFSALAGRLMWHVGQVRKGTRAFWSIELLWELPPELEFITGKCLNGQVDVTGSAQQASSSEFTMGVGGYLDFEIQVRVLSAPDSNLVKAEAIVTRVSDGVRLAEETESTTLKR